MTGGDSESAIKKGSGGRFNMITKWVMRKSTGVPRSPDIASPASATPTVSTISTALPIVQGTAASAVTACHCSDDQIAPSTSFKVPPSDTLDPPSVDARRCSRQPAPSPTPVSDVDGETSFFDAHTHPPSATQKNPKRTSVEKVPNRPPLKLKLSVNHVKNFHDVVRRLQEMVPAEGINPAKHGNGREMYAKAMRLQEHVMKTNKIPRT